jgi:glycine/serine hydroxymethyltransferase
MAKLEKYQTYVQQLIENYAALTTSNDEVETEIIFDTKHNHYQLVDVGWKNERRIYGCILHIDIKDGKIWIQHNGTENHIAHELNTKGVPKEDIVLGFHSPYMRQFTEFAVN